MHSFSAARGSLCPLLKRWNGQSFPQLHLGPGPHLVPDCVDAMYLLQLSGSVASWSGQSRTNQQIAGPDLQL